MNGVSQVISLARQMDGIDIEVGFLSRPQMKGNLHMDTEIIAGVSKTAAICICM